MSFTGPRDPSIAQKMARTRKQGLILIAAAGNAGPKSSPLYPAAYPNVIAVTATDADDRLFQGANRGNHIAVAAPGVDLLLPAPEAGYQMTTGTSFAAAEVSGIAALLLERKPDLGYRRAQGADRDRARPRAEGHRPAIRGRPGRRLPGHLVARAGDDRDDGQSCSGVEPVIA
jgi:subtilisin family serine protease